MKVIKLIPENIVLLWDSIYEVLDRSLAPNITSSPYNRQNIMMSLMAEKMQCWAVYDDDKRVYGHIITLISTDTETKEKTLIIYAFSLVNKVMDMDTWVNGLNELEKFAKSNGCRNINAYSCNENVISIAKKMGFDTKFTFLMKEV